MSSESNSPSHEALKALREALQFSPQKYSVHVFNILAILFKHGFARGSGKGIPRSAGDRAKKSIPDARIGSRFSQQNKDNHAFALFETLTKTSDAPPRAFLLHAKLLFKTGEVEQSIFQYRRAIELDASLKNDAEFAERFGIGSDSDEDEIVEGKVRSAWEPEPARRAKKLSVRRLLSKTSAEWRQVKEEIRMKIIHPLTHADLYKSYGKSIGGGILLYGPPGCGKTYLARATAGEIKSNFLAIGINDMLEMWIGSSERNLHDVFENARAHKPCVLFFDEVDALGASRSDMKQHAGRQLTVNQFLSEMDGVNTSNDGVLILAATNAPWHFDSAFRRPGRFDRILFVPPPDAAARASILRLLAMENRWKTLTTITPQKRPRTFPARI